MEWEVQSSWFNWKVKHNKLINLGDKVSKILTNIINSTAERSLFYNISLQWNLPY